MIFISTQRGGSREANIGGATYRSTSSVRSVSAGGGHAALVLNNGEVYTWGVGTFATQDADDEVARPFTEELLQDRLLKCNDMDELHKLLELLEYSTLPSVLGRAASPPSHAVLAEKEYGKSPGRMLRWISEREAVCLNSDDEGSCRPKAGHQGNACGRR